MFEVIVEVPDTLEDDLGDERALLAVASAPKVATRWHFGRAQSPSRQRRHLQLQRRRRVQWYKRTLNLGRIELRQIIVSLSVRDFQQQLTYKFRSTARMKNDSPVASTSRALAGVKLDPQEEQRLERLLTTIESCFCDWGLSVHRESGLLDLIQSSKDGCEFRVCALRRITFIAELVASVQTFIYSTCSICIQSGL